MGKKSVKNSRKHPINRTSLQTKHVIRLRVQVCCESTTSSPFLAPAVLITAHIKRRKKCQRAYAKMMHWANTYI